MSGLGCILVELGLTLTGSELRIEEKFARNNLRRAT